MNIDLCENRKYIIRICIKCARKKTEKTFPALRSALPKTFPTSPKDNLFNCFESI